MPTITQSLKNGIPVSSSALSAASGQILVGSGSAFTPTFETKVRLSSDFIVSNNATLSSPASDIANLGIPLISGKNYAFEFFLAATCAGSGGFKIDLNGVGSGQVGYSLVDHIIAAYSDMGTPQSGVYDFNIGSGVLHNSPSTVVQADQGSGAIWFEIFGSIAVNVSGLLLPRFAQKTSTVATSRILVGSYGIAWELP
jgi:hypothetical protein